MAKLEFQIYAPPGECHAIGIADAIERVDYLLLTVPSVLIGLAAPERANRMEIFFALAVIAITILGVISMSIARLAAAAAAISAGVARISREVNETGAAIRAHLEGDSGISQSILLGEVEKLEAAGAALTEAADSLDSLQTELGGNTGDEQPEPGVAGEEDSPSVTGDALGDSPADGGQQDGEPDFGNQNGIGSDFEQGAGGGSIDVNSQSDGDQPQGQQDAEPTDDPSTDPNGSQSGI